MPVKSKKNYKKKVDLNLNLKKMNDTVAGALEAAIWDIFIEKSTFFLELKLYIHVS